MPYPSGTVTPLEAFYQREQNCADDIFLRQPLNQQWREYPWRDFADQVRRVAAYLRRQNFPPQSRIAIVGKNCADWLVADFAIMLSGHISVPLYPGQDAVTAKYILEHSESMLVFVGEFNLADRIDEIFPAQIQTVGMQFCNVPCATSIDHIVANTAPFAESPIPDPDAIFTILYTSGTSGHPKGVMHAYGTPGVVLPRMQRDLNLGQGGERERFMSYLPLSHAAERCIVEMNALYCNGIIAFSEGLDSFATELSQVQPTFFFSVPRLWVKFKAAVDAKVPAAVQAKFGEAEREALRKQLGLNEARVILTGSAPCPTEVQNWFLDIGVFLREGYSMTENFCDGCFWLSQKRPSSGCVGRPLTGVQMKFTDQEEICFRSDGLMKGYYKDREKTDAVLIDGWYHTGDTGKLDEDGNLWITGRISEVFKTTKGKFIQPNKLEDSLNSENAIQQVCVCGHGLNQPVALVTLSPGYATKDETELKAALSEILDSVNSGLPAYQRLDRLIVDRSEWTIDNGLLTPTMKIKRKALHAHLGNYIRNSSDPKDRVIIV